MTITVAGGMRARRLPSFTLPLFMASAAALTPAISWANSSTSSLLLEEVVVTAQKRAESVLEVPITIDNFSADDITNTGALTIKDIDDYIPGFEASDNGVTQNSLNIRGVSSSNISIGGDPSVATFYDGVYLPQAASTVAFSDMARVEVLKGPQGTLYGRNASAGVVNLIPNSPAQEEEGFVAAKIGTDGLMRFEGMINTALTDNVALRVNLLTNERDGYIENLAGGGDGGAEDNQALRAAVLWDISDATTLQVAYDWDKVDNSARPAVGLSEFSYSQDPFSGKTENDLIEGGETRDMQGLIVKLDHEIDDQWSMRFTTSYREWEAYNREEEDGTSDLTVYGDTINFEDSNIFYNEISFHFTNDRYDWVMGANYSKEDVMQRTTLNLMGDSIARAVTGGLNDQAGTSIDHIWNQEQFSAALNGLGLGGLCGGTCTADGITDSVYNTLASPLLLNDPMIFGPSFSGVPWAEEVENHGEFTNVGIFSDVNITLNEDFNLLLGLRHSRDEKTLSWWSPTTDFADVRPGVTNQFFNAAGDFGFTTPNDELIEATESWSKTTGRAVLKYQISDTASTFLSFSTGYKAGGFDSLNANTADQPFAPEESTNYEWGIKGDFLDGRLRTQLSLFSLEIDNLQEAIESQLPGQVAAIPVIISGNQQLEGIEMTTDWVATDNLRFGLITTLRDEEKSFAPYYNDVGTLIANTETSSTDLAYTLTADWTPGVLSTGELLVHVDYIFQEQSLKDDANYQPIYDEIENFDADKQFLNARVSWLSDDQSLEVALWGKNLLDNQYTGIPGGRTKAIFGSAYVTPNAPLSWGVDAKYSF